MTSFELISIEQALSVATLDSSDKKLTSQPEDYAYYNAQSYYILINTWLNLINENAPVSCEAIRTKILNTGLIPVIASCSNEADKYVRDKGDFLPFSMTLYNELTASRVSEREKEFLFLLRFPKRFSPSKVDALHATAIKEFLEVENRSKMIQRNEYPVYITTLMKSFLEEVFPKALTVRKMDRYFSNGACYDANTLYKKVQACANECLDPAGVFGWEFPLPPNGDPSGLWYSEIQKYPLPYGITRNIVTRKVAKLQLVNKNYKAARIIAEEESLRQFNNTAVLLAILRNMKRSKYWKEFQIDNQDMNRDRCRKASIECDLSTIDLSHASDCNTKSLVKQAFPNYILKDIGNLPTHVQIDGKIRPLQMAATAGCVLTFVLETLIFWSIARTAKYLYEAFTGDLVGDVSVYGDDIIVPTEITELTIDLLQKLGFIVNEEKTFFGSSPYRETCGAEFFNGIDVSTSYFPRKTLEWNGSLEKIKKGPDTNKALTSIVELQHKLFSHKRASMFLCSFVREVIPNFSSSNPADGFADLWEEFPTPTKVKPPVRRGCEVPECCYREGHYAPISSYKNEDRRYIKARDLYEYRKFLLEGVTYDEPILELLGCPAPTTSLAQGTVKPDIIWVVLS